MAFEYENAFELAELGVSAKTREAYKNHYRAFIDYIRCLDPVPPHWETSMVLFRAHLARKELSAGTIASYITGI